MKNDFALMARLFGVLCLTWLGSVHPTALAAKDGMADEADKPVTEILFEGMAYRGIGPFRGGRSAAVTGIPGQPKTYFFGATGGGVWTSTNGGESWDNVSDGFFGGSIGAVAVSEWDPNIIYVGGGEKTVRGNVSSGTGMWKSNDKGKTWHQIGLTDSRHIARVRIHPRNPDLVYAAVMGHLSGPNEQRGVFRSRDGGANWEKVLYVSDEAGAVDLIMDPTNPRVLYASTWKIIRTPWSLESGGEGSGLWKSTDGGDTWQEISRAPGLPKGTLGIIGVTVSPANPDRVWAIIEAEEGGVFRSEDGGQTWRKINDERKLRQRAWYYTRIYADPQNEDRVYVLNVRFWRSKDGGKTYESIRTPHGDHHDLWIDPDNPQRMIVGDDGGAQVTTDGGESWTTYYNQPTAQFYRVTTDNAFPYRIYGAQQDNSTVRIDHRAYGGGLTERHWEPTAGGESGHIAPHPENPDVVYGGSYGGYLTRLDHETGAMRAVNVWPDNPMGHGAASLTYRFQWNFPIFFSPHDAKVLYTAGNKMFKSTNEGQSWQVISPDLTTDDKSKQGPSGGPITKDNTSVEYYCTIFAAMESHHEPGVIWAGSDDGLIHVTRNGGEEWQNVTPKDLPEWTQINSIEIDPHRPGGLYVAGTRYKLDDFTPYLYKTEDYGRSWKKIVNGIPSDHFTRVIRADPKRDGLLYAGTEQGIYVSFDDGAHWMSFQMNLPITPITDLAVKNDDLVVATQGRSFWILDDLTPLHQFTDQTIATDLHLFAPRPAYRVNAMGRRAPGPRGEDAPNGVWFNIYHKAPATDDESPASEDEDTQPEPIELSIYEADGDLVRTFRSDAEARDEQLNLKPGFNRFAWNMLYPDAKSFDGMIVWSGGMAGPPAVPGSYTATLRRGEWSQEVSFEIKGDPRLETSQADYQAQFDFLMSVRDKLSETHDAIARIRTVRSSVEQVTGPLKGKDAYQDVIDAGKAIDEKLTAIEEALYQTKNRSRQDPLNFPIRLNDKLAGLQLARFGAYPPTDQMIAVRDELMAAIDVELAKLTTIEQSDVPAFNELVAGKSMPAIWPQESDTDEP